MLIDKLRQHLISTSLEELKKEWELVEHFGNVGPMATDLVDCWRRTFLDVTQPASNLVFRDKVQKEFKNETPEYSEFFFNIVLWKRKLLKPHFT